MDAQEVSFNPIQLRALRAAMGGNITVCNPWGRGGGKSKNQRLLWYILIAQWEHKWRAGMIHPGIRIVLLMPTLEQAKKVHATLMLAELTGNGEWAWLGGKVNRSEWRVDFPGGSWIQWVTAERATNIAGLRCDVISVDECDDIDTEVYDAITIPWFSEHHSLRIAVLSGTPRKGRYGLLYRTYARAVGKLLMLDGARFANHFAEHATCYDFPEFVSPIAVARAKAETPSELFAREWLCDFDSAEGLVYPHFREDFHVRDPDPDTTWNAFIVGVDWGFEDPLAVNVYGIAGGGKDITIHQIDEVYVQHKTAPEIVDIFRRLDVAYPGARYYADPSRPDSILTVKRACGIKIFGADNAIEDGVGTCAGAFHVRTRQDKSQYAQLYISPSCVNAIRELKLYRRRRDPRNKERVLDDIEDKNNHACDAMRYAIHSHFGGEDRRVKQNET